MMRDIRKYVEAGHKRLEGNARYDISNNEINNLMVRGLKSPGDMFFCNSGCILHGSRGRSSYDREEI